MKITAVFPLGAALCLAAGCTTYDRHPRYAYETSPAYGDEVISSPGYPTRVYRSPREAAEVQRRADQDLIASVRDQFDQYGYLNEVARGVDVTARNGTITLSGVVPTRKDRDMIDAMVRNTRGVAAVNNQLQVTDGSAGVFQPTGRPDATYHAGNNFNLHVQGLNETDRQLAQQIMDELQRDPAMSKVSSKVDIHVANGEVTLRGPVSSDYEKQAILAAVERAAGPYVRNELRVRPLVR